MAEPFIICDNLVRIYKVADHDVVALQGLDLVVQEGELLGVVGVSGSGKSTLMNILGGLDRPTAGRVWVNGCRVESIPTFHSRICLATIQSESNPISNRASECGNALNFSWRGR
mgnify:CR=1 FL=1